MLVVIPTYIALNVSPHSHSVKQSPSALVNFRVHAGILTCTVVSHAHLTLQCDETSEEFYFHMHLNLFTFMTRSYVLRHFQNMHIFALYLHSQIFQSLTVILSIRILE
jgi:hypothetical protein